MLTKIYTIRIDERCKESPLDLWYKQHVGEEFTATLAIVEVDIGSMKPVFRQNVAPFFDIFPLDCTVIEEKVIEN